MAGSNVFLNELFAMEYLNFCKAGELPACASLEVLNILEAQKKRQTVNHVTVKTEGEPGRENEIDKFGYLTPNRSTRQTPHFLAIIRQDLFFRHLNFLVNGELSYSERHKDVLVTTAVNQKENTRADRSNTKTDKAQEAKTTGTEGASQRESNKEKWPRVTDFYFFPNAKQVPVSAAAEYLTITGVTMFLTLLYICYLSGFFSHPSPGTFIPIFLGAVLFGLIIGFMIWMPFKMFSMMHKAKKNLSVHKTMDKRTKILLEAFEETTINDKSHSTAQAATDTAKEFKECFDYEYFYGQLMTKLQALIYSEHRESLPVYTGKDALSFLDDIMDFHSDLSLKVKRKVPLPQGMGVILQVGGYTYRLRNGQIKRKHERFLITLQKTAADELSFPFEITNLYIP